MDHLKREQSAASIFRSYDTASTEFVSKPYKDESLNEIIKESGISKGNIYNYFGDKFGFLISLLDILLKKKTEIFLPCLKENPRSEDISTTLKRVKHMTMEYMLVKMQKFPYVKHLFLQISAKIVPFR